MKLPGGIAGARLAPHTARIFPHMTQGFAAALEDDNPLYFDDERPGGIVAPPTFPVAVTWPIIGNLPAFLEPDSIPAEALAAQVHYTEHLILHRPVRPEDTLSIEGEVCALIPHRAGTHAVIRLTATDADTRPVFTEYTGALLRGVALDGDGSAKPLPERPTAGPGATAAWTSRLHIPPLAPYIYESGTDIRFPIHTSPKFAKACGLPGIILQGTATLGFAVRELVRNEAGADPLRVREIAASFTGMVMPDTDIEICCLGVQKEGDISHIFFEVINARNQKAIRNGYMKVVRGIP